MENMAVTAAPQADFWRGKSVLVTGHTGFKGAWLSIWLDMLGSQVFGFALDPHTQPSPPETSMPMSPSSRVANRPANAATMAAPTLSVAPLT